ncbi:hypothetical protein [Escherichia coli ISC41]|nr:hypothetical protein [Escherichia coli ISC41]
MVIERLNLTNKNADSESYRAFFFFFFSEHRRRRFTPLITSQNFSPASARQHYASVQ